MDAIRSSEILKIDPDVGFLAEPFWKLDTYSVPPVYRLQPISTLPRFDLYVLNEEQAERFQTDKLFKMARTKDHQAVAERWSNFALRMRAVFQKGVAMLPDGVPSKYSWTSTRYLMDLGIITNPKANDQAFCFSRRIANIETVKDPDIVDPTLSQYYDKKSTQEVTEMRDIVDSCLDNKNVYHESSVTWVTKGALNYTRPSPPAGWQNYLDKLCDNFIEKICDSTFKSYKKPITDPLFNEVIYHRAALKGYLHRDLLPVPEVTMKILDYVRGPSDRNLIIHGPRGSGKSSAVSLALRSIRENFPSTNLIYRFVGSTKASSNVLSLISSISTQLLRLKSADASECAHLRSWKDACRYFSDGKLFGEITTPLVVVLDGIDKLSDSYKALEALTDWLPGYKFPLPSNTKFIITTNAESKAFKIVQLLQTYCSGMYASKVQFLKLGLFNINGVSNNIVVAMLTPFTLTQAYDAIDALVAAREKVGWWVPVKKVLHPVLRDLLITSYRSNEANQTPLFLSLALDIMLSWPSYSLQYESIEPFTKAAQNGSIGLVHLILERAENIFGRRSICYVLGLLTAAKDGFTEVELEDILCCDEGLVNFAWGCSQPTSKRFPPLLLQGVLYFFRPYLTTYLTGNENALEIATTVLRWKNSIFMQTIWDRYLKDNEIRRHIFELIAMYFQGVDKSRFDVFQNQPLRLSLVDYENCVLHKYCRINMDMIRVYAMSPAHRQHDQLLSGRVNSRLCSELPFALLNLEPLRAAAALCNIIFIMAKVEAGMLEELLQDFLDLISMKDMKYPVEFNEYWRLVSREHYRWRNGNISVLQSALFFPDHTKVYIDAEKLCDSFLKSPKTIIEGDRRVLLSLWQINVGKLQMIDPCLVVYDGHSMAINTACFSPDGWQIASASADRTVKLWDVYSDICRFTLESPAIVLDLSYSPSGTHLACALTNRTIVVWDLVKFSIVSTLWGHQERVTGVNYSFSGTKLLSSSEDDTVKIWTMDSAGYGVLEATINCFAPVTSAKFSPNEAFVVCGLYDGTIKTFDMSSKRCTSTLSGHSNEITSIFFSPRGDRFISSSLDKSVKLWNVKNSEEIEASETLYCFTPVYSASFSPNGNYIACALTDSNVKVWDLLENKWKGFLKGHTNVITSVQFSPDSTKLVSASWDKQVRLWDMIGEFTDPPESHVKMKRAYYKRYGRGFATESEDSSIKIWSTRRNICTSLITGKAVTGALKRWTPCLELSPEDLPVSVCDDRVIYAAEIPSKLMFDTERKLVIAFETRMVTVRSMVTPSKLPVIKLKTKLW